MANHRFIYACHLKTHLHFCKLINTILAKIIFKSVENIFDHLVRPFWPIFFGESFGFFVATMVNGSSAANCQKVFSVCLA